MVHPMAGHTLAREAATSARAILRFTARPSHPPDLPPASTRQPFVFYDPSESVSPPPQYGPSVSLTQLPNRPLARVKIPGACLYQV
jgi:hypothetical protein